MSSKSYLNENPGGINWLVVVLIVAGILLFVVLIAIFFIIPKYAEDYLNKKVQGGFDDIFDNTSTYDCSSDKYNCNDFSTQAKAQAVFDYCFDTAGDIHRLDADGNGKACEALP